MRIFAIINQKGGCGKTTTAINLSSMLARAGRRTLLVDMDPQGHCAAGLGIPDNRIDMDIGDAMLAVDGKPIDPARLLWRAARNLDLAPARMKLAGLEASRGGLAEVAEREHRLTRVLEGFRHEYDAVCIDCPPSIGLLTFNALAAATTVLIPVETAYFSLQGATRQVGTIKTLCRRLGRSVPVWMVPTLHEEDNPVAGDLLRELGRRFEGRVAPVVIRRDSKLREAASFGQPVADYCPGSPGARDYQALAQWILLEAPDRAPGLSLEDSQHLPAQQEHLAPEEHAQPATSPALTVSRIEPQPAQVNAPPLETAAAGAGEMKPSSRAEDVARRAQEFLRRVALGRAQREEAAPAAAISTPLVLTPTPEVKPVTPNPSVQRLFGVTQTNQGVLFVQPASVGREVSIAGSFNQWSATSHRLKLNSDLGVHELCLRLPPGRIEYRLVIDGVWSADPYNDRCEINPFGEPNSIVEVGAGQAVHA